MSQSRNKKLAKDIVIYGIGNLGSKLITFLLVPLYTFYINKGDYGYYDGALMLIFFLMPMVTLQLRDGTFRFLIDSTNEDYRKKIISQSYKLIATTVAITIIIYFILSYFINIRCGQLILWTLITFSIYEVQIQIIRGLGHTKLFVLCGIINCFSIAIFCIFFIVLLGMGIEGIFYANIIARIITLIITEVKTSTVKRYFTLHNIGNSINKELLHYCGPLIIVSLCIGVIGYTNRFFIIPYLGFEANGLFAVAFKFAAIIEILAVIIFQAWQETSVLQQKASDKDEYYSSILNLYILSLTGLIILLSFGLKTFYGILVESQYTHSLVYIYVLCIAEVGYALQIFMAAIFQAEKHTKQMFPIAISAAAISIILNYTLIRILGLTGISISYGISFGFMFICYFFQARKTVKIVISKKVLLTSILMLITGGFLFYLSNNIYISIIFCISCICIIYLYIPQKYKALLLNKLKKNPL